jgi:hypothetical protein
MLKILKWPGLIAFNLGLTLVLFEGALRFAPLPEGFRVYLQAVGMLAEQESAYMTDPTTGMSVLRPKPHIRLDDHGRRMAGIYGASAL